MRQARLGLGRDKLDAPKCPTRQSPACSGNLVDDPQNAIRVRANNYPVAIDNSTAAPVLSCEDGHIFGNSLAGKGHTCEASAGAQFRGTPICPLQPVGRAELRRRCAEVRPDPAINQSTVLRVDGGRNGQHGSNKRETRSVHARTG